MQTRSKKPATRSQAKDVGSQLDRFKAMAAEVGADDKPGALDRAFGKIDPKAPKPEKKPKS
jgi:hypothetical protein